MTEELINALSRVEGLRITSRTSVFSFKKTPTNVRDIAAKLGVAWVLEGSVRKAGNRLRITAQLIAVRDDSPRWSDIYERELDDVFAVQNEIARAIVTALSMQPHGRSQSEARGRAHRKYRGLSAVSPGQVLLEQARRLEFAARHRVFRRGARDGSELCTGSCRTRRRLRHTWRNGHRRPSEVYPKAKASALRALEIDPSLSQPHSTLGLILTQYDWDFEGALEQYRIAAQLTANYSTVPHWRAWTLVALGRLDEALSEMRRAHELDPLSSRSTRRSA